MQSAVTDNSLTLNMLRCYAYVKDSSIQNYSNAWWGFADRQRVEAVLRQGVRSDILTAAELIEDLDDDLFQRILRDTNHLLHALLPDRRRSLDYRLRPRCHDRELVPKASSLIESNFLI